MTELRFTQPIKRGEQWVVTLYAPAEDIRHALFCISRIPEIPGPLMILDADGPDTAEIRLRDDDSWARIMADLDLVFTFVPITETQLGELRQQAS
jgi:hypothetical protein